MKDNLFDLKFTFLDVIKIAVLFASLFSTWYMIDLITPDYPFAFVRIGAFVLVVEGSLIGFERATKGAKTEYQSLLATVGFFSSLAVIGVFMLTSGFLEFSGPTLLATSLGNWLGIEWTVNEVITLFALVVVCVWVVWLSTLARLFSLADPDKQFELQRNKLNGRMKKESNAAFDRAMKVAEPEIAIQRALLAIETDYGGELNPNQLAGMKAQVESRLRENYQSASVAGASTPAPLPTSAPVTRPTRPAPTISPVPTPVVAGGNGNGNGQHPTP